MTPAEQFYYTLVALAGAVVAVMLALVVVQRAVLGRPDRRARVEWTPDVEAAISEALAVVEHVDDCPEAEYAIAALRRDLAAFERGEVP